ncbi:MAG: transcriptional regulator [Bryobacterales bacterium]|nr:transcriptional regulator [Bryobacterales bacterium]
MALTRDFKVTVRERLQRDPAFREALLKEAVNCLLSSDIETGKSLLRDYVNATIGFGELGGLTDKSPKSLMRMLSQNGNPQAHNLFEIISCLQRCEGVNLKVQAVKVTHNVA